MPVGEMLGRMSSAEITEWLAFYQLEPFGGERDDLRTGIVAATVANVNRDPKKQKRPFEASDFMPVFPGVGEDRGGRREKSPEELRRKWEMVVAAFGGRKAGD